MILKYLIYEVWLQENDIDLNVWLMKYLSFLYSNILDMNRNLERKCSKFGVKLVSISQA